jgi:uracil-DNA glycosylase family 4
VRAEEMTLGQTADWFFSLAHRWPDVFDDAALAQYWQWSRQKVRQLGDETATERHRIFVGYLRAGALKMLRGKVSDCTACPLHKNRMRSRPVLDDCSWINDPFGEWEKIQPLGATSAEIMVVAEGPGRFEQRTGVPFVSFQVLIGSVCAWECGEFENCYGPESELPKQPCKPTSLRKNIPKQGDELEQDLLQIRMERASIKPFKIMTVAGILDRALRQAGLWREGWNPRQSVRDDVEEANRPRPGTVYLTNMVKCRSCVPKKDDFEDVTPSREDMDTCSRWLEMQVHILQPKVMVALGNPAIGGTTQVKEPRVLSMRGSVFQGRFGVPVLADVHPSFISRKTDAEKRGDSNDPITAEQYTQDLVATFETAKGIVAGTYQLPWPTAGSNSTYKTEFPSPKNMSFTSTFGDNNSLLPTQVEE